MKKIIMLIVMAIILLVALVGCGREDSKLSINGYELKTYPKESFDIMIEDFFGQDDFGYTTPEENFTEYYEVFDENISISISSTESTFTIEGITIYGDKFESDFGIQVGDDISKFSLEGFDFFKNIHNGETNYGWFSNNKQIIIILDNNKDNEMIWNDPTDGSTVEAVSLFKHYILD